MSISTKEPIRNVVLYEFHKIINASAAVKSIQRNYGVDALSEIGFGVRGLVSNLGVFV